MFNTPSFNTSSSPFVSVAGGILSFRPGRKASFWSTLFLSAMVAEGVQAQNLATVRVEENLRAEPQGVIIGRLLPGSTLSVLQLQGRWAQVDLQGWIWTRSTQVTDRTGFDLAVSVAPQENLRADPSGEILAHLLEGALLERLEDVPGWTRVRRVAWVWLPSLDLVEIADPPSGLGSQGPVGGGGGQGWWRSGPRGAPVLSGPDGDTLAQTRPGIELQLLAREGNWVRVKLEGWSWAPLGEQTDSVGSGTLLEVTPDEVMQDPESYRGQVVSWDLQFISHEEAERVRTDFYEGEPFLLTRSTAQGRTFVYVAVPPERRSEVEGLIPLERIRIVGRIRTGAAALTGNPILDLLELIRISGNQ
jgi:hypothetical protein